MYKRVNIHPFLLKLVFYANTIFLILLNVDDVNVMMYQESRPHNPSHIPLVLHWLKGP